MKQYFLVLSVMVLALCGCGSSTTNVSLSASSFDFGVVTAGTSATQTVAVLSNTGTLAIVFHPTISGTGFSLVSSGGCGTVLAPGQMCNVMVEYSPSASSMPAQQTATVNLDVQSLKAGTSETIMVAGTPGASSSISLSSNSYDFGDLFVGATASQTVSTLTNTGATPVQWRCRERCGPCVCYGGAAYGDSSEFSGDSGDGDAAAGD